MSGTDGEQTTMGSGGPRRTARRSAPPHPGSRKVRERDVLPAEMHDDEPVEGEGGSDGEGKDDA